jgi:hypothetical protein
MLSCDKEVTHTVNLMPSALQLKLRMQVPLSEVNVMPAVTTVSPSPFVIFPRVAAGAPVVNAHQSQWSY